MKISGLILVLAAGLIVCVGGEGNAEPIGISARRLPHESAETASRRAYTLALKRGGFMGVKIGATAQDAMRPFAEIDLNSVKVWNSKASIQSVFESVRDERMVQMPDEPKFPRRLSWLYPDDGCFARADLERKKLESNGFPSTQKILITGDLSVKTANAPGGFVTWWWHISDVVRVGNEVFVLDPAIEPTRPLPVREWIATMVANPDTAQVAICSPYTYSINSDCGELVDQSASALTDQFYYLDYEWTRQIELGRDPKLVLGEQPPWKK